MTYADKIRSMTDEELAVFLYNLESKTRIAIIEQLSSTGIDIKITNIEVPSIGTIRHLRTLRQPVDERKE